MIGKKFGKWTILQSARKLHKKDSIRWLCKCDCGNVKIVSIKTLKNESKPRSCGCSRKIRSEELFETKFEKTKGCWIWKGCINRGGYGKIGTKKLAHRISYEKYIAKIPKGKQICHHCDNRKCVNPEHLFVGSIADNMQDKVNKNRQSKGSNIGSSILTEEKVLEIRKMRLSGKMYQEIADHFKIQWDLVRKVCKKDLWTHVPLLYECKKMNQIRKYAKGEKSGSAIFTEEKVKEARKKYREGLTPKKIAELFGVSISTVHDILKRRTWNHVP